MDIDLQFTVNSTGVIEALKNHRNSPFTDIVKNTFHIHILWKNVLVIKPQRKQNKACDGDSLLSSVLWPKTCDILSHMSLFGLSDNTETETEQFDTRCHSANHYINWGFSSYSVPNGVFVSYYRGRIPHLSAVFLNEI